ncbi:MAG: hypothetical protein R8G34_18670 [Paracoccaceae bacterium]|nr:hypothetical protein [Paracoccaceae bacterium]
MGSLMTVLAFGTIGFITVLGYLGARATQRLKDDPAHKPSTLCATSDHWDLAQR